MRVLYNIVLGAMWLIVAAAFSVSTALAQNTPAPLTKAEQRVCKDLDMCVDLLLRHGLDEFDYEVLGTQFQRFGEPALEKLLYMAGKNRKKATPRAQEVLGQKGWRFSPTQQKEIADLWPSKHPEKHALIMAAIGSPMMRDTAMGTLVHPDENTRLASRYVLRSLPLEMDFPLPPQAASLLSRAANQYPSPELASLIAKLDAQTAQPLLRVLLQSGDMETVNVAWDVLKRQGMSAAQQGEYLALIWPKLKDPANLGRADFFALARRIKGERTTAILRTGLTDQRDWRVTQIAALALGERRNVQSKQALLDIANSHPILHAKAAAKAALAGLSNGRVDLNAAYDALKPAQKFCDVEGRDFMDAARQMPFFDSGQIQTETGALIPAKRPALTTAMPTKAGWLAGYQSAQGGGLLYYDNQSGDYKRLSDQPVKAIIPTEKLPLGQYANRFWVIMDKQNLARITHLDVMGEKVVLTPHAVLPARLNAINILPDHSLEFGFIDGPQAHPPLKLLPNGGITSGCEQVPQSSDPASQVLPK